MLELAGEAAFVTGAGSGIGRAIAQALAVRGAFVWSTDFNEPGAAETAKLIGQSGGRAEAIRLDVSDEGQWQSALALSDTRPEPLTVLVNCAGTSMISDTFSMPIEDFRRIMSVNVEGTFLGMKHAIPRIADAGGGAVINISSMAGLKGIAGMTAYCGSKGAIRLMTKAVALECAGHKNKVRVNSVHPGLVDTPALRKHIEDATRASGGLGPQFQDTDEVSDLDLVGQVPTAGLLLMDPDEVAKTAVPIGVACSPAEVADTVCFLASDAARHITGTEIAIDGGMTAG